jgi:cation:H+ antiporter
MLTDIGLLLVGLCLLFLGGEGLVRGAVSLANRLRLPHLVIGLTIVGFGTSMPELLVSVQAAWGGHADIAVGNVAGSNMANILLILGLSAAITPLVVRIPGIARDVAVMMAAAFVMLGLGFVGGIGWIVGLAMVAALSTYIGYTALTGRKENTLDPELATRLPALKEATALLGGLAALVAGAHFLVASSVSIASAMGVSESVIGLTIVAVGTSLPELATSIVAAYRRHSEVAVGNVVGSNIFNIFGILGLTAIVKPVRISSELAMFDIPTMVGVSVLLAVIIFTIGKLSRAVATLFLIGYAGYIFALF